MAEVQREPVAGDAAERNRKNGKRPVWRRKPVIVLGTLVLGGLLYWGLGYLAESFTHEATDDAFLDANIVSIAPKVAGQVISVPVTDNQAVKAGELLVQIDPRDLQIALDQKRSAVTSAHANTETLKAVAAYVRAQIAGAEATAKQSTAEGAAAEATAARAKADLSRAEELIKNKTISPQEYDTAKATADAAQASLRAAREKAASDQAKITESQAQFDAARKAYDRAEAQTAQAEWDVKAAELNLSYAQVTAPEAGFVTRKAVQAGDYVQVGQRLMALVPMHWFVTANFKETQLVNIKPGQPASISIDALGGRTFDGHVDSIQAGSGARFSLLPPENAVGNYVKIVQRVPVKIVFNEPLNVSRRLGPGMSVVPSVHVTSFEVPETWIIIAAIVIALLVGIGWWWLAQRKGNSAAA